MELLKYYNLVSIENGTTNVLFWYIRYVNLVNAKEELVNYLKDKEINLDDNKKEECESLINRLSEQANKIRCNLENIKI